MMKHDQSDQFDAQPFDDANNSEALSERPWIALNTTHDVESWIDHFDRDLQRCIKAANSAMNPTSKVSASTAGYGVCFVLAQGGEIYLHTTEGAILLDVTPEAEWVAPVIAAATGVTPPRSQIWTLPEDRLTQVVLGLSSLIASSRLVLSHNYKIRKY